MMGQMIAFYCSELVELAKEGNVKDSEMDDFLAMLDTPENWIIFAIEKFKDDRATEEMERII